jgi:hypothetical protein
VEGVDLEGQRHDQSKSQRRPESRRAAPPRPASVRRRAVGGLAGGGRRRRGGGVDTEGLPTSAASRPRPRLDAGHADPEGIGGLYANSASRTSSLPVQTAEPSSGPRSASLAGGLGSCSHGPPPLGVSASSSSSPRVTRTPNPTATKMTIANALAPADRRQLRPRPRSSGPTGNGIRSPIGCSPS